VWLQTNAEAGDERIVRKAEALGSSATLTADEYDGMLSLHAAFDVAATDRGDAIEEAFSAFFAAGPADPAATWYIGISRVEPRYE
jgi:hypothetical protein